MTSISATEANRLIGGARRGLVRELTKKIATHLRECGYRTAIDPSKGILGGSRPLRVWVPIGRDGKPTFKGYNLNGHSIQEFMGVNEHGVVTDIDGGGLVDMEWDAIAVEDLLKLRAWLNRHLPTIKVA